jgi:hypothetical protein
MVEYAELPPSAGPRMISAAQVIFANDHPDACLDWLSAELPRHVPFSCSRTQWRGRTITIPQILVATSPVRLTIQVEDSTDYVPEEIAELAEDARSHIDEAAYVGLRRCNARLDLMSTTPPRRTESTDAITIFAETDLDPAYPDVEQVLAALSELTGGFVLDCVNGRLRIPGHAEWIAL